MKTLLITLLLLQLFNGALASNPKIIEPDEYLQESIALSEYFKTINKSIQGIDFFTVGADGACNYSSIQAAIDDFAQSPLVNIEIRIARNKTYLVLDRESNRNEGKSGFEQNFSLFKENSSLFDENNGEF